MRKTRKTKNSYEKEKWKHYGRIATSRYPNLENMILEINQQYNKIGKNLRKFICNS